MLLTLQVSGVCISRTKCRRIPHNQNARLHWAERLRWNREWYDAVRFAILEQGNAHPKFPLAKPRIGIVFHQVQEMDRDNLFGSAKVIVDAVKKANVIADDGPEDLGSLEVTQKKVKHRTEEKVEININY